MKKKLLLLAVPFLSLVSCQSTNGGEIGDYVSYLTDKDSGTATIRIFKDESATSTERYISPKMLNLVWITTQLVEHYQITKMSAHQ